MISTAPIANDSPIITRLSEYADRPHRGRAASVVGWADDGQAGRGGDRKAENTSMRSSKDLHERGVDEELAAPIGGEGQLVG
jgi:hypothetical protein